MAIYMKINGISGNVTEEKHKDWIEVGSIHYHVNRNVSAKAGISGRRAHGMPDVSHIRITKNVDESTPLLLPRTCEGESLDVITIEACQTGKNLQTYLQYKLYDAILSHYSVEGIAGADDNAFSETLKISYSKIETKYIPRDNNNNAGTPVASGYDLAEGAVL